MDQWNQQQTNFVPKIQQFNIGPATTTDSTNNRYIPNVTQSTIHNLPVNQVQFGQGQILNTRQPFLVLQNPAQNTGNVLNQNQSVQYQINHQLLPRQQVVNIQNSGTVPQPIQQQLTSAGTVRQQLTSGTARQQLSTAHSLVHNGKYTAPNSQQPTSNMNYISSQSQTMSIPLAITSVSNTSNMANVQQIHLLPKSSNIGIAAIQNWTNSQMPTNRTTVDTNKTFSMLSNQVHPSSNQVHLSSNQVSINSNHTSISCNQVSNSSSQNALSSQSHTSAQPVNKTPQNLIYLYQFLKKLVESKNDISVYLQSGTPENRLLVDILCYKKFRIEFLKRSNNTSLKMQILNKMGSLSQQASEALQNSESMNSLKNKSTEDIFETILNLTTLRGQQPIQQIRPGQQIQVMQQTQLQTQQVYQQQLGQISNLRQPSPQVQASSHCTPPPPPLVPIPASKIKREPGLIDKKPQNSCSGPSNNQSIPTSIPSSVAQNPQSSTFQRSIDDLIRMSDEAAEPYDSLFDPIVNPKPEVTDKTCDVKPIPVNHLSVKQQPQITPSLSQLNLTNTAPSLLEQRGAVPMTDAGENFSRQLDVKPIPVKHLEAQSERMPLMSSLPAPQDSTTVIGNPESFPSADDSFLNTLEELQQSAIESLKSTNTEFPSPVINIPKSVSVVTEVPVPQKTSARLTKKDVPRPLSPNNMCRVEAEDQAHICSSLIESNIYDKKTKDMVRVKKNEVICSLSSTLKPKDSTTVKEAVDRSHYWCNFCVFQTDNKLKLVNHVISAHRFSCQYCAFQCYSRADVVEHTINTHKEAIQVSKDFRYCVLLPDYLKIIEQIEDQENQNYESDCLRTFQTKKMRAHPESEASCLESDWEEEFMEDTGSESASDIDDVQEEKIASPEKKVTPKSKGRDRKRKRIRTILTSDEDNGGSDDDDDDDDDEAESKKRSILLAHLSSKRKAKKAKLKKSENGMEEIQADAEKDKTQLSAALENTSEEVEENPPQFRRQTRRTTKSNYQKDVQNFEQLEEIFGGEEDNSDYDDDKDEDFDPSKTSEEKHKKRKTLEEPIKSPSIKSPVASTSSMEASPIVKPVSVLVVKTQGLVSPVVHIVPPASKTQGPTSPAINIVSQTNSHTTQTSNSTKTYNLMQRCVHCEYSTQDTQLLKLHSLDSHQGQFLGIWHQSLDILLYICPRRFCDFYGSMTGDYICHLEKCSIEMSDYVKASVQVTKEYVQRLKEKRIAKPTKLEELRTVLKKISEYINEENPEAAKSATDRSSPKQQEEWQIVKPVGFHAPQTDKTTEKSQESDDSKNSSTATDDKSKDDSKTHDASDKVEKGSHGSQAQKADVEKEELDTSGFFKCAFCSFKAMSNTLTVRSHSVKQHPEFPLYTINLKAVETGKNHRFVLFCVGIDCEAVLTSSEEYFKHIETCDAVKQLKDDTQLLKTNKFVKTTIHRL
ncbi:uncharacterized protein LOC126818385 [Patella vulgata]|uniref:uncharacterized protein LOC126818385 n=1 Tax=Patella vulgata TaxID=6465 RepID=UPI002180056A|nr:uncharacterized protein LOC126818385 [Patella vulgata]